MDTRKHTDGSRSSPLIALHGLIHLTIRQWDVGQITCSTSCNMAHCTFSSEIPLPSVTYAVPRDGLAMRYLRDPHCLPSRCDGCGGYRNPLCVLDFTRRELGLIIQRHNEMIDYLGDMAPHVYE